VVEHRDGFNEKDPHQTATGAPHYRTGRRTVERIAKSA